MDGTDVKKGGGRLGIGVFTKLRIVLGLNLLLGLGCNRGVLGLRLVSMFPGNRLVFSLKSVLQFRVKCLGGKSNCFIFNDI